MLMRTLLSWVVLLFLAVGNGALREGTLVPRFGPVTGHQISTLLLSTLIVAAGWPLTRWIAPTGGREALLVGGVWLGMTLAFEFLGGHFAFGKSWSELFADYDLTKGRIWPLVLIVTTLTPWLWHRRP
jgi:hypothetical protein